MNRYLMILVYNKTMTTIEKQGDWAYKHIKPAGSYYYTYTTRHKVRLFFGIHGQMHDGRYCFDVPTTRFFWLNKKMHTFMFKVGSPVLNFLIGYDKVV